MYDELEPIVRGEETLPLAAEAGVIAEFSARGGDAFGRQDGLKRVMLRELGTALPETVAVRPDSIESLLDFLCYGQIPKGSWYRVFPLPGLRPYADGLETMPFPGFYDQCMTLTDIAKFKAFQAAFRHSVVPYLRASWLHDAASLVTRGLRSKSHSLVSAGYVEYEVLDSLLGDFLRLEADEISLKKALEHYRARYPTLSRISDLMTVSEYRVPVLTSLQKSREDRWGVLFGLAGGILPYVGIHGSFDAPDGVPSGADNELALHIVDRPLPITAEDISGIALLGPYEERIVSGIVANLR
ncbi:hypothetical protein M1555_05350 [Patescibacteria group bacterium]|nr:hypothetical protein [Patescibacteria group bacterium]